MGLETRGGGFKHEVGVINKGGVRNKGRGYKQGQELFTKSRGYKQGIGGYQQGVGVAQKK